MAYVKQNFVDGNVLYASELNHIEDGIADAYVKPASGIPTADIANDAVTAVKLAANAVSTLYTATIPSNTAYWEPYGEVQMTQITVNGLLASDHPIIDVSTDPTNPNMMQAIEDWGLCQVADIMEANTLTVVFSDIPTVDIPIKILCIRK